MTVGLSMFAGVGAQLFDANGDPLSGGLIYTYAAGTTTPVTTYQTSSGSGGASNSNPIVLDSAGRVPYQIWLTDGTSYKFVLKTSAGATVRTEDNVYGGSLSNVAALAASSGSSLVGFIQAGTGAVLRTAQAKMREALSITDFGAVGDGNADCYAAWVLAYAALPDTGGIITFPISTANKWYFSQGIVLNKPVRIMGQMPSSSYYVSYTGTVLEFAADKTGITVNSYNSVGANPALTPAGNWCEIAHLTITSRGGKTGLLNGGTGVVCDGILNRGPGTRITNVWATTFKRNGIRIVAAIGSGGVSEGNANLWYINDVHTTFNGSDGVYIDGSDTNAGLALKLNSTNNGGYGVVDSSFLGNTYIALHTDANVLGSIVTDDPNAQSVFIGTYAETGEASLVSPSIMIGGLCSSTARVSAASTALVIGGGGAVRKPYTYIDTRGATTVGSTLGRNDSSMTAITFGALTESTTLDAWKLQFDNTYNAWKLQFGGSVYFEPIRYINSASTLYTLKGLTGPVLQNGYGVRNAGDAAGTAKVRLLGTAAPVAGTYEVGDILYNSAPASAGYIGWVCTAAGTPGTWKTFGLIS